MKKTHRKATITNKPLMLGGGLVLAASLLAGCAGGPPAAPEKGIVPGYVTDGSGRIVRNGHGTCWINAHWKPELAVEECHPELVKKEPMAMAEPAPRAAPAMPKAVSMAVMLDAEPLFQFGKSDLKPEAQDKLSGLVSKVDSLSAIDKVVVRGHTDRIGPLEYNQSLSERRAQTVADFLIANSSVPQQRFEVVGVGPAEPVVECKGERGPALIDCLQPNRRVTVEVAGETIEYR